MEHVVNPPKGTPTYIAESLGDLAQFFNELASKEAALERSARLQRDRIKHHWSSATYRDVANTILQTSFEPTGLARMLEKISGTDGSKEREEVLSALSEVLSMNDIDGLQKRLP